MRNLALIICIGFIAFSCGENTNGNNVVDNNDTIQSTNGILLSKFDNSFVTESGVKYIYLEEGTGKTLVNGDKIKFHYVGKLADGTQFESSYDYDEPYIHTVGSADVIVGLADAIGKLKVGDIALLWIPSHLAYGSQGTGPIPANSDLVFQIEIVEVIPKPTPFDTEGLNFSTTETGLQYCKLNETHGDEARIGDIVFVHYSGYLLDGTMIDSSVERGEPYGFQLGVDPIIDGWVEGLQLMRVGEKMQIIIPPELAYGERGTPGAIPPNAVLTFDLELISIQKL